MEKQENPTFRPNAVHSWPFLPAPLEKSLILIEEKWEQEINLSPNLLFASLFVSFVVVEWTWLPISGCIHFCSFSLFTGCFASIVRPSAAEINWKPWTCAQTGPLCVIWEMSEAKPGWDWASAWWFSPNTEDEPKVASVTKTWLSCYTRYWWPIIKPMHG